MGLFKTVIKQIFKEGAVESKNKLSESAYRIRIKNDSIKNVEFMPGHFLRVLIGMNNDNPSREDFVRSYSVWNIDKPNGTIDLAIATHSAGAGAKWVEQISTGDKMFFNWKKGNFILEDNADSYLMVGDLSALSHLYIIKRHLPQGKQVESILYSEHKSDLYPDIDGATPFDFYEMPQNPIEEIFKRVVEIVPKMTGRKMVYIGGDSRVCVALNKYFRNELRWDTKQIKTKPFWNPEKKGLE
jgi:NADPH-dependent ferric siderophore reductase